MLEQLTQELTQVLLNVLLAIISLGGVYAVFYINKAKQKLLLEAQMLADENQRQLVNQAIHRLEEVTLTTVEKLEQTTAKTLRKAVKEGVADKVQLKALARDAYAEIMYTLSPKIKEVLAAEIKDLETYTLSLIEQKVLEVKRKSNDALIIGG